MGACAAVDLRLLKMSRGRHKELFSPPADGGWQREIEGVLGELVVASVFGVYWRGAADDGSEGQPDDVDGMQVRATPRLDGCLIVHRKDLDDAPFILVCGIPPTFTIPGWLTGAAAKQLRWWRNDVRSPAYFVPQSELHPIEQLIAQRTPEPAF